MYKTLFRHYWLNSTRAPGFYKNVVVNIFVGLLILYFVAVLAMIGLFLPKMLQKLAPQTDILNIINGSIIYSVIVSLLLRYLIQPLSQLKLEHYQTMPIKRDVLVNYLLLKPLLNPINYIALCFIIPITITGIYPSIGLVGSIRFFFIISLLIQFNTLMSLLLKRKFSNILIGLLIILVIGGILAAFEYYKIFSLFSVSRNLFGFLINTPFVWVTLILFSALGFYLNKLFFAHNYYPESFERLNKIRNEGGQLFYFLDRYGKIGEIISLEIKLILRHKRTKSSLYTIPFFLLYGLIFYFNPTYSQSSGWIIFVAIFITGAGMLTFGQWIINWDGSYFDFLMSRNIDTYTYLKANYTLLFALCLISFILTTPYFLLGKEIILYHLVALVYNAGVNIYVFLFGATFNSKRLELTKSSSMNMQGVSYKNFVVMIPLLAIPIGLINLFSIFSATNLALIIIALIGVSGILLREQLLRIIVKQFLRRKYALCEGFRKKE